VIGALESAGLTLGLRIFDTMSMKKLPFAPNRQGQVTMFVCGPTVQAPTHIGHARTYVFYDVVARYLRHLGFGLKYLVNITDIDERITAAAEEEGTDPMSLAAKFSQAFIEDMSALKVVSVDLYERVSDYIEEATRQVCELINGGYGYVTDGWVYFDTSKFPAFGKLSHQKRADLRLRPLELSPNKRNLTDFSLWRPEELVKGRWKSPWGIGSPGWHIQDTAITSSIFGDRYDIHGGGYELVYPHHEAEIAQGESLTGHSPMVKYWVHTGLVNIRGTKMSKSLGNALTVRQILKKVSPDALRLFLLRTHYRKDAELDGIGRAEKDLMALRGAARKLVKGARGGVRPDPRHLSRFYERMNDDFDTPGAIEFVERALTGGSARRTAPEAALSVARASGEILGIDLVGF
jgi:cysteinyl-tRNA synthetase